MESPLNLAHQHQRSAEAYLRARRYDDALHSNKEAAKLLQDAMQLTEVDKILQSLDKQYQHHINQEYIIRKKQAIFQALRKSMMDDFKRMMSLPAMMHDVVDAEAVERSQSLPLTAAKIYSNLAEMDSLFTMLLHKNSQAESRESSPAAVEVKGKKQPKTKENIIEELQIHKDELKSLVAQLIPQLEFYREENDQLRNRVSELEEKLAAANGNSVNKGDRKPEDGGRLQVLTDSQTSPYVISPYAGLSPIVGSRESMPLPTASEFEQLDNSKWSEKLVFSSKRAAELPEDMLFK